MKTNIRNITITLITLIAAGLIAVNTVTAQEPVSGELIAASDLAFLKEAGDAGIQSPVTNAAPVGLFSAAEARYLAAPFAPLPARAEIPAPDAMPGQMISSADLRFITGPGTGAASIPETWAAGSDRFGIGQ